ncbi:hypothetical protein PV336_13235 [Streptomyces sp. MI02-2A]|uniref:hypothetical protein n=1 Tax=unclassified Streptomyces TaxID=2593676 RepID=UPI000E3AAB59|nr:MULTISPECIES: hypothetical protein [unclassified Streptomyces]MDX3260182.1 hypothetical protein [Streptomyces sp. MI02-2A]REE64443.1 hypothetical protein BX257_7121 [Streptomyces sp. 3212.3]
MRTGVVAVVVAGCGTLLAACTSASAPAAAPSARPFSSPTSAASSTAAAAEGACTIYLYGHAARAEVRSSGASDPAGECRSLASSMSQGGDFWTTQAVAVQGLVPEVCAVQKDGVVVVVRDTNAQIFGQNVCSALLQGGWAEDAQAERSAQQQDQQTVHTSAQASARAADQSTAKEALATLQGSNSAFTNAKSVRDDLATADNDLAQLRKDAKGSNGEDCYNVENVVGYDAENVVGYDVTSTASYDVDQEQQGITDQRSEITALKDAQAALTADGLPTLAGASTAIATAEAHITKAITTTNRAIDDLNADMKTAYRIANALGTGDCAGTGPGEAPEGLSHIS